MGFEELVEQLKGARGVLVRDRERIDDEINRVDAAIRVLDGAPATEVATIAFEHNVDVMVPRTTKGEHKKPTAQRKPGNSPEQARARWAEVFEWAKAAKADGTYSIARLNERFGPWANNWRVTCAKYGMTLDGPTAAPPAKADEAPAKPTGKPVLRCADCGWECATDKAANLDLHCRGTHRRPATTAERTPVAAA